MEDMCDSKAGAGWFGAVPQNYRSYRSICWTCSAVKPLETVPPVHALDL